MNLAKNIIIATALTGILSVTTAGALQAADASSVLTMKPLHGVSFDVGTKHAVSYFLSDNGLCHLTLIVAEAFNGDDVPADTPNRFEVSIDPGKTARIDAVEGKSLEFACQASAQAMSLTTVERFAVNSPPAN